MGKLAYVWTLGTSTKHVPKRISPLPIMEIIIDNTSLYKRFYFMDGFYGYNQMKMDLEGEKHTAFQTLIGIYYYKVMPFWQKNARATYQRAINKIFDDLIHHAMECYFDDLVVKLQSRDQHINDLKTVFDHIRIQLKNESYKMCIRGAIWKISWVHRMALSNKDCPSKVKEIIEMPPLKTLKQLRPSKVVLHISEDSSPIFLVDASHFQS